MRGILKTAISAILLGCAPAASAQGGINDIINAIAAASPQLASDAKLAAAQQLDEADANSISNPEVSFARVWGRHGIGNKLQLDVSQSFDWPGLYRARSQAAKQGRSAAEMLLLANTLDVKLEAKSKLYELVYLRKQIDLQLRLKDNLAQLEKAMQKACDRGECTALDHKKIAIEAFKLDNEISGLHADEAKVIADIQAMCPGCELDLSAVTEYPIECILTLDEYLCQIKERDPLLASGAFSIEQEEMNARAATQSRLPSLSVGYQHQAEMGDRFNGFTVGMSLPFFENRHARAAALDRREAATLTNSQALARKEAETRAAMTEMKLWREQVENYNSVLGDNAYLTLLQKAYEGGQINILDFFSEIQYYSEATNASLLADYNYRLALAMLNKYDLIK